MTTIQVGCNLTYSVTQPTNFLFNVAVARTEHQTICKETLQLVPDIIFEASSVEDNQVHRLYVEPCDFQLQCKRHPGAS